MTLRERAPWWAKILAKACFSRLPLRYHFWRRSGLFVHGLMDRPEYAYGVVTDHMRRLRQENLNGKVVLELGPGNGLFSALIVAALGARRSYLVDVGPFAGEDLEPYQTCAAYLRGKGLRPPDIGDCGSIRDVMDACNAVYLTSGIDDLRKLPTASVDFLFSQAVLEHLRLGVFGETIREIKRLLSATGATSHQIDLKDHLGDALNNLRFSHRVWESNCFASSGFYTNRLRFSQILCVFKEAGFDTDTIAIRRWAHLPTPRRKFARAFRGFGDDELLIQDFGLLAWPVSDNTTR